MDKDRARAMTALLARVGQARKRGNANDRAIDRLVYELYGLTDKEIAIVDRTARS